MTTDVATCTTEEKTEERGENTEELIMKEEKRGMRAGEMVDEKKGEVTEEEKIEREEKGGTRIEETDGGGEREVTAEAKKKGNRGERGTK